MIATIEKLEFSIGGYFGGKFEFMLNGDKCKSATSDYPIIDPSTIKIKKLNKPEIDQIIRLLNKLEVANWKKEYWNDEVIDGTQWELKMKYNNGSKLKSFGSNHGPFAKNGEWFSDEFETLITVLKSIWKISE